MTRSKTKWLIQLGEARQGPLVEDEEDECDLWERDTWYTPTRDGAKFSKIPGFVFAPPNRERRDPIYIDDEVSNKEDDDNDKQSQISTQLPDEYGYIKQSDGQWFNIHTKKVTYHHALDEQDYSR